MLKKAAVLFKTLSPKQKALTVALHLPLVMLYLSGSKATLATLASSVCVAVFLVGLHLVERRKLVLPPCKIEKTTWILWAGVGLFFGLSLVVNKVDPRSAGITAALTFMSPLVFVLSTNLLRGEKSDTIFRIFLTLNAILILAQIPAILSQSQNSFNPGDKFKGLMGENGHVLGMVMAMNTVLYFFVLQHTRRWIWGAISAVALVIWILTSTVHAYILMIFVLVCWNLVHEKWRLKNLLWAGLVILIGLGLFRLANPIKFKHTINYIEQLDQNNKLKAYRDVFIFAPQEMPHPWLGAGPGNYASRAAQIRTGILGYASLTKLLPPAHPLTEKYVVTPIMVPIDENSTAAKKDKSLSTATKPVSSWIALIGETGPISFILATTLFLTLFFGLVKNKKDLSESLASAILRPTAAIFSLFYLLIAAMDNWYEVPQVSYFYWIFMTLTFVCRNKPASACE